MITKLLRRNPHSRITAQKALKHKWFKYVFDDNNDQVNRGMLTRLTNFKGESTLKRAGLDMLVGMISQDEIRDLKAQFIAMDKGGDGTIEVGELAPILKKSGLKMKDE